MRRIVATVNTTIDGYMEGPGGEGDLGWLMPFVEDALPGNRALLESADTILLGRRTYNGFSRYWPAAEDDFAPLMNEPTKLVFSRSLTDVGWGKYDNARLADVDTLRALKQQDGEDMVATASGGLVSSLLGEGLVDELQLVVVPVVLGRGTPYLRGLEGDAGLALANVEQYRKGSVRLTYRARR